jgi:hypothetical protein
MRPAPSTTGEALIINAVRTGTVVLVLLGALSGCTPVVGDPAPQAAPAVPGPASRSVAPPAGFTSFATTCPQVGERAGALLEPVEDTATGTTADCGYGDQAKFPHVTSTSVIDKTGNTTEMYRSLVSHAKPSTEDGITATPVAGLGDEATLVVSYKDNLTLLIVRSGNALIQALARVDAGRDRDRALSDLHAQEPVVTAMAQALLAELR